MHPSFRTLRIILLLFVGGFGVWSGEDRAQAGSDSTNVIPPNYRELIARYMLTLGLEQRYLRTAMIAKPFNKPDGISGRLTGTTVPRSFVCPAIRGTRLAWSTRATSFSISITADFVDGTPEAQSSPASA